MRYPLGLTRLQIAFGTYSIKPSDINPLSSSAREWIKEQKTFPIQSLYQAAAPAVSAIELEYALTVGEYPATHYSISTLTRF